MYFITLLIFLEISFDKIKKEINNIFCALDTKEIRPQNKKEIGQKKLSKNKKNKSDNKLLKMKKNQARIEPNEIKIEGDNSYLILLNYY